jgi:hypothetical protein
MSSVPSIAQGESGNKSPVLATRAHLMSSNRAINDDKRNISLCHMRRNAPRARGRPGWQHVNGPPPMALMQTWLLRRSRATSRHGRRRPADRHGSRRASCAKAPRPVPPRDALQAPREEKTGRALRQRPGMKQKLALARPYAW